MRKQLFSGADHRKPLLIVAAAVAVALLCILASALVFERTVQSPPVAQVPAATGACDASGCEAQLYTGPVAGNEIDEGPSAVRRNGRATTGNSDCSLNDDGCVTLGASQDVAFGDLVSSDGVSTASEQRGNEDRQALGNDVRSRKHRAPRGLGKHMTTAAPALVAEQQPRPGMSSQEVANVVRNRVQPRLKALAERLQNEDLPRKVSVDYRVGEQCQVALNDLQLEGDSSASVQREVERTVRSALAFQIRAPGCDAATELQGHLSILML